MSHALQNKLTEGTR